MSAALGILDSTDVPICGRCEVIHHEPAPIFRAVTKQGRLIIKGRMPFFVVLAPVTEMGQVKPRRSQVGHWRVDGGPV
ncbi:hypothetical protein [Nitrospirillum pindoramense]|uniref:hypothetical protein n=1 Tax=Nitrospirillum amazonense TaxID=28077 RepID=UPI00119CE5CE|nr:hypothetical protein [Nitrospirillum amazonense]